MGILTVVLSSVITLIIGLFLGRKISPRKPLDNKIVERLKKDVAFHRDRYNNLRIRHNKLVDLVTSALNKPKGK